MTCAVSTEAIRQPPRLRRWPARAFSLLLAACLAALAPTGQAAPRVLDAQGGAERSGARGTAPLALFELLVVREQLSLRRDATVTLMFDGDGRQLLLRGPGRWEVHADRVTTLEGAAPESLATIPVPLRAAAAKSTRMTTGALSMRNQGAELPLQPDASRLLEPPPQLSWSDLAEGVRWRVTLATADGVAVHDGTIEAGVLSLSGLAAAVKPGMSYAWQVEALSGPRQGQRAFAAFSVASGEERDRWRALQPPPDAPVAHWTVYAAALESAGFAHDARQAWARVAQARPGLRQVRP